MVSPNPTRGAPKNGHRASVRRSAASAKTAGAATRCARIRTIAGRASLKRRASRNTTGDTAYQEYQYIIWWTMKPGVMRSRSRPLQCAWARLAVCTSMRRTAPATQMRQDGSLEELSMSQHVALQHVARDKPHAE